MVKTSAASPTFPSITLASPTEIDGGVADGEEGAGDGVVVGRGGAAVRVGVGVGGGAVGVAVGDGGEGVGVGVDGGGVGVGPGGVGVAVGVAPSSFRIVPMTVATIAPCGGRVRFRRKISSPSTSVSPQTGTVIGALVCVAPAANASVTWPLVVT
jgi:hypothetical protein